MKILVTGWQGMIGRNVKRIIEQVTGTYSDTLRLCDLKDGCDLRDPATCKRITDGIDRVFHLADRTAGLGYAAKHHGQMMTDSLLVSLNLLGAAHEAGVTDYLYVSSSCVYADHHSDEAVPEFYVDTNVGGPEKANQGYGWAKRIGERQCQYFHREYGMRTIIVRPANVYGPSYDWSRPVEDMHVIPALITKMLRGDKEIVVWGSGNQRRTFQYERDAAHLMVELMEKGEAGEVYNMGGVEMSIRELTEELAYHCNYQGAVTYDASKPEGPQRKAQDVTKLGKLLGYDPVCRVNGFRETVDAARRVLTRSV